MVSTFRIIGALALVVSGSIGGAFATGALQKPGFGVEDRGDWQVSGSNVSIVTTGWVYNPNSFDINLSSLEVDYRLRLNGQLLAEGGKNSVLVPKNQNSTVQLATDLKPGNLPGWWVSHISQGETSRVEVPLKLEIFGFSLDGYSYTDTLNTDIESKMGSALGKAEGNYSGSATSAGIIQPEVEIRDTGFRWGEATREHTEMLMTFHVHNPNSYTIPAPQLGGSLDMNDVRIAEWNGNDAEIVDFNKQTIQPGETQKITFSVDMDNRKIDDWFVSHVRKGEMTQATLNTYMIFEASDISIRAPAEGYECDFSFRTGLLEDQNSSGSFDGCSGALKHQDSSDSGSNDGNQSGDDNTTILDPLTGGL